MIELWYGIFEDGARFPPLGSAEGAALAEMSKSE